MYICSIRICLPASVHEGTCLELLDPVRDRSPDDAQPFTWQLLPYHPSVPHLPQRVVRQLAHKRRGGSLCIPVHPPACDLLAKMPVRGNGTVQPLELRAGLLLDLPFALHYRQPLCPPYPLPTSVHLQHTRTIRMDTTLRHYPEHRWTTLPAARIVLQTVRCTPKRVSLLGYLVRDTCPPPLANAFTNAPLHHEPGWLQAVRTARLNSFTPEPPPLPEASFQWLRERPPEFRWLEVREHYPFTALT